MYLLNILNKKTARLRDGKRAARGGKGGAVATASIGADRCADTLCFEISQIENHRAFEF